MLADFVRAHREEILVRARERVATRRSPPATDLELAHGVPLFLSQLIEALVRAKITDHVDHEEIETSSVSHGRALFGMGISVAQVVHGYGDVCQVVTELVVEQQVVLGADQFRILNLCLDDAIAGAVTEYARLRERALEEKGVERLGDLAHELRNTLNTAVLAFESIRRGQVAVAGSTGGMLARSLYQMRELIDRSLTEVRLEAGGHRRERFPLSVLLEDVEIAATLFAAEKRVQLAVENVDTAITLEGDRLTLASVVSNLLHNAIKFTPAGGKVLVSTRLSVDRVIVEVADACGGLPPGSLEGLFLPYSQRGTDRSGLGLGLSIALKAARASGGDLVVRDVPGHGCVFTLEVPR